MRVAEQQVIAHSVGENHIFYTQNSVIGGLYIVYLALTHVTWAEKRVGFSVWKNFLALHPDPIYFSTLDPGYIGNHCKLFKKFGSQKVYQYVR
jgi:hypothetical protein